MTFIDCYFVGRKAGDGLFWAWAYWDIFMKERP